MFRSSRSRFDQIVVITAIIGGIAAYWWMFYDMGASSARHHERAQKYASYYAADTVRRVETECAGLSHRALADCAVKIADANRENQRSESDLAAQWQAANWVLWASVIAGAQLIATMLGLYFVKRTLEATLEAVKDTNLATKAMQRQNELTEQVQRPWIIVDSFEGVVKDNVTVNGVLHKRVLFVYIYLKNIGSTIASNVGFITSSLPHIQGESYPIRDLTNLKSNPFAMFAPSQIRSAGYYVFDEARLNQMAGGKEESLFWIITEYGSLDRAERFRLEMFWSVKLQSQIRTSNGWEVRLHPTEVSTSYRVIDPPGA